MAVSKMQGKKPPMRRPQDGMQGKLKYPAMYNQDPEAMDQMEISDMEAQDSGDPFLNLDAKPDQDEQDVFELKSRKLRRRGMPSRK